MEAQWQAATRIRAIDRRPMVPGKRARICRSKEAVPNDGIDLMTIKKLALGLSIFKRKYSGGAKCRC
jgi:hypothetical protein